NRGEGDLVVLGRDRPALHSKPCGQCLAHRGPDQARLAEPRLARDEERVAATAIRLGDQLVEQLEQMVAADEDRALDDAAGAAHRGECRGSSPGAASVERPMDAGALELARRGDGDVARKVGIEGPGTREDYVECRLRPPMRQLDRW